MSAAVEPPEPKAMSTANMPVIQAPTNGTNDKTKYMMKMGSPAARKSNSGTMKTGRDDRGDGYTLKWLSAPCTSEMTLSASADQCW